MARKKLDKPTKSMRDAAWRALNEGVTDTGAADYARIAAAKAIVKDDPDAAEAAAKDEPEPAILILPINGRNPTLESPGITREGHVFTILYDAGSAQGLADLERFRADVAAEIEAAQPVLLSPSDGPRPLTGAERVRRFRERKRQAQAASAAPA